MPTRVRCHTCARPIRAGVTCSHPCRPDPRRALAAARQDIRERREAGPWVAQRLTDATAHALAAAGLELRNRPDASAGYLIGVGQYRRIPAHPHDRQAWRDL